MAMHVSEFSENGKYFAILSKNDGHLKIWDSESNQLSQEYIPNLHLTIPCTCFTWINLNENELAAGGGGNENLKKARKSIDHHETAMYLAIGTNKGGVGLYSYASGKIERYLKGDGHTGAVTSICIGEKSQLITCGEDSKIILWNLMDGCQQSSWNLSGNETPTCLVYLTGSNRLVIGSRHLKLWSFEKMDVEHQFIGHITNCTILKYFQINSNEYVLSAPKMDRTFSLWCIKSKTKSKNAIATFLMEDVAFFLNCIVTNDEELKIVTVTRTGVVHFFDVNVNSVKATKPIKPKVTIEIATDSDPVEPIPIITASLEHAKKSNEILIGYGEKQSLHFEQVTPDFSEKRFVLIRNDPKKMNNKMVNKMDTNLKTLKPIIDNRSIEYQMMTSVQRRVKPLEIPMETRLENISLTAGGGGIGGTMPQGKSLVQLLTQGLLSNDTNILRTVFSRTDEKIIRMTLQNLKPQFISPLIDELTILAQKRTTLSQVAVVWLKILLQTHASQIMAFGYDQLFSKVGPILGIIEHRTNTLKPLQKLNGRLDLLINQIKRNTEDDVLDSENLLVFEDNDSIDEDDLNENDDSHSSDNDQWNEEVDGKNDTGNVDHDDDDDDQEQDDDDDDDRDDADEKMELSDSE